MTTTPLTRLSIAIRQLGRAWSDATEHLDGSPAARRLLDSFRSELTDTSPDLARQLGIQRPQKVGRLNLSELQRASLILNPAATDATSSERQ